MFLDEPTTGLDPRSRNQVWEIIRALVAEGTTILLCTQYLEEADQLADGIAVIDHGRVIAEGTPGQLKASVGSGALHVRLLDPEQRPRPSRLLARALGAVTLEPDPAALSAACADADRGAVGGRRAGPRRRPRSPTSRSASRASTRCSWPSPAIRAEEPPSSAATRRSKRHDRRPDDAAASPAPTRPPSARPSPRPRARRRPARCRPPSPSAGAGCSRSSTCPSSCST